MFYQSNPIAWSFHRSTARMAYGQAPAIAPPLPFAPNREYTQPGQLKEYPAAARHPLPPPESVPRALGEAIALRASCRRFADTALPATALSTLLHNAYGVRGTYRNGEAEMLDRPVPSGGGCYPLEIYLLARNVEAVPAGIYHYNVLGRAIEQIGAMPEPETVATLFLDQPWLGTAHAIAIVTAVTTRLLHRYADRGYRYLFIEAGHVGQNLALVAAASGLGSLSLGGFLDDDVTHMLGLDPAFEIPLYGIALGVPATANPAEARGLEITS